MLGAAICSCSRAVAARERCRHAARSESGRSPRGAAARALHASTASCRFRRPSRCASLVLCVPRAYPAGVLVYRFVGSASLIYGAETSSASSTSPDLSGYSNPLHPLGHRSYLLALRTTKVSAVRAGHRALTTSTVVLSVPRRYISRFRTVNALSCPCGSPMRIPGTTRTDSWTLRIEPGARRTWSRDRTFDAAKWWRLHHPGEPRPLLIADQSTCSLG